MSHKIEVIRLLENISNSNLVIEEHNSTEITYVGAGLDGAGEIKTVLYKLDSVLVATLTLSYNADNKLINVVKS